MSLSRDPVNQSVLIAQEPYKVKTQELERVNAAYVTLEANTHFKPIQGVPYLWVYTSDEKIIVGIEEAWKYPQAFVDLQNADEVKRFDEKIKPMLKEGGMLGHPTLACAFDKDGTAQPKNGKALIGGELRWVNQHWQLDNQSGRFGLLKNTPEQVQTLMNKVKDRFKQATGIKPYFTLSLPHAPYLRSYYRIWSEKNENCAKCQVDSALKLLEDYTKSSSMMLWLTGHWRRHHVDLVKSAMCKFKASNNLTVQDILHHFSNQANTHKLDANGSLMRRLKFIAAQTNHQFTISPQDKDTKLVLENNN